MIDLSKRSKQLELIDTEPLDLDKSSAFLKELELINKLVMSYSPTLFAIGKIIKKIGDDGNRPVSLLDVGFGYGDMLRKIAIWAEKKSFPIDLTGIDSNPGAKKAAEMATPDNMKIRYLTTDIFADINEENYDIVISSLFTHHLEDHTIVKFLNWMHDHANYGWFVNDLHRHHIPYYFIKYFVRLFGFDRLILNDAPLSVARSFVREDWERLIRETHIERSNHTISWHCPFRYCILCLV